MNDETMLLKAKAEAKRAHYKLLGKQTELAEEREQAAFDEWMVADEAYWEAFNASTKVMDLKDAENPFDSP